MDNIPKVESADDLEAGPRTNGFVLHEIFGMKVEILPNGRKEFLIPINHPFRPLLKRVTRQSAIFDWWTDEQGAPPFSTDIAWAWKVVEAISARAYLLPRFVTILAHPTDNNLCSVMMYEGGARTYGPMDIFFHLAEEDRFTTDPMARTLGVPRAVRAMAETLPLAICRCALKVVCGE